MKFFTVLPGGRTRGRGSELKPEGSVSISIFHHEVDKQWDLLPREAV